MNLGRYPFIQGTENLTYEFYSEGPRGIIKKVVHFERVKWYSGFLYNLAFGDWDETTESIDDKITSNNLDREKVLATVAAVAVHFMSENQNAILIAKGSTPARTRLYQIGIANFSRKSRKYLKFRDI
jgi:hypothetical protein